MLLDRRTLDAIVAGDVDLVFRRWRRPTVKTGGTLRTAVGMLAIDAVEPVDETTLTDHDARRSGHASLTALLADLAGRDDPDRRTYRITVRPGGDDPRIALRESAALDAEAIAELDRRLDRLDAAAPAEVGAWTRAMLRLLAERPHVRAVELAESVGRERAPFKADVAKLKRLGLTISHSPGYELSPRGRAYLTHLERSIPGDADEDHA